MKDILKPIAENILKNTKPNITILSLVIIAGIVYHETKNIIALYLFIFSSLTFISNVIPIVWQFISVKYLNYQHNNRKYQDKIFKELNQKELDLIKTLYFYYPEAIENDFESPIIKKFLSLEIISRSQLGHRSGNKMMFSFYLTEWAKTMCDNNIETEPEINDCYGEHMNSRKDNLIQNDYAESLDDKMDKPL